MFNSDWNSWERGFWELRDRAIPYDEATYILLLHGYLLSHRHAGENAFLVIEEMRQAEIHPALVRLSERLLNSAFELKELGARPETRSWLQMCLTSWHCAARFKKKRHQRLRSELEALEPNDALALEPSDIQRWIRGHDQLALPEGGPGLARFQSTAFLGERPAILTSPPPRIEAQRATGPSSPRLLAEGGGAPPRGRKSNAR